MNEAAFLKFLRQGGRSESAANRVIEFVKEFEAYIAAGRKITLDEAVPSDLESYVAWYEADGDSAKLPLWAIRYYYEYIDDFVMVHVAGTARQARVEQRPFPLHEFRGVSTEACDLLAKLGIRTANDLLGICATPMGRLGLVRDSGADPEELEELIRLSDLARIPGLKGIRARLYLDAGVDSVEALAARDPKELRDTLVEFVSTTGFDGIPPTRGEVLSAVETAGRLRPVIDW